MVAMRIVRRRHGGRRMPVTRVSRGVWGGVVWRNRGKGRSPKQSSAVGLAAVSAEWLFFLAARKIAFT